MYRYVQESGLCSTVACAFFSRFKHWLSPLPIGRPTPVFTVILAFLFCAYNGLMQAHALIFMPRLIQSPAIQCLGTVGKARKLFRSNFMFSNCNVANIYVYIYRYYGIEMKRIVSVLQRAGREHPLWSHPAQPAAAGGVRLQNPQRRPLHLRLLS